MTVEGQVVATRGNTYEIWTEKGLFRCALRKKLKRETWGASRLIAVGDRIRFTQAQSSGEETLHEGVIDEVLPRKNELCRADPHRPRQRLLIAANVDLVVVIQSAHQPDIEFILYDRGITMAACGRIPAAVCLNKIDLSTDEIRRQVEYYKKIDTPVVFTSATERRGLDELRALLYGKTAVFLGPSGAGKTSLIGALNPSLQLKVGEVSERTGEGRHTTTWIEFLDIGGGRVADTPGLELFTLAGITQSQLIDYYPEFEACLGKCKFRDCQHDKEPGCAVRQAVEAGEIWDLRYRHYLKIRNDLPATPWEGTE